MREEGLIIYATTRQLSLSGGNREDSAWPEAVVQIIHERDALTTSPEAGGEDAS